MALYVGGYLGTEPQNLAADASGTHVFWDSFAIQNYDGMAYTSQSGLPGPFGSNSNNGESILPLHTYSADYLNGYGGHHSVPKVLFGLWESDDRYIGERQAVCCQMEAAPEFFWLIGCRAAYRSRPLPLRHLHDQQWRPTQELSFFITLAIRTRPLAATRPGCIRRVAMELGRSPSRLLLPYPIFFVGTPVCMPGAVIAPGDYCAMFVTHVNGTGLVVSDTLHFLTNAVNNDSVSFQISGLANPAP